MQTIEPKKTKGAKRASTEKKHAGKVSMSYHPDRRGTNLVPAATHWDPDIMGSFPAPGPKGRFQDSRKAKQAEPQHKGAGKSKPDTSRTAGYCVEGRKSRNRRPDRNTRDTGYNGYTGHTNRSFRERSVCADIPRYVEPEHYSSTCCGKCKHYQRIWRGRVWVCDNRCSEKHGFPTDYGNTCDSFEREDRGNL